LLINTLHLGGRQADATVMAATAAAARSARGVNGTSIMRRSGSLMDFSGKGLVWLDCFPFKICSNACSAS